MSIDDCFVNFRDRLTFVWCGAVNPLLTPTELGYFCVGFIFWLGALVHVSFYLCIDLSLFLILRVLSLVGQLAFTDMGTSTTTTTPSPTWVRPPPCCCGYGSKGIHACCRRAMQQLIDIADSSKPTSRRGAGRDRQTDGHRVAK